MFVFVLLLVPSLSGKGDLTVLTVPLWFKLTIRAVSGAGEAGEANVRLSTSRQDSVGMEGGEVIKFHLKY